MAENSLPQMTAKTLEGAVTPIAQSAAKLSENVAAPLTTEIGGTLQDVWTLIFGKLGLLADKRRAKYAVELEKFKSELNAELAKIPAEKRVEPSVQVAMNALEDARSCVEEPTLREMFSKLLAASSNADKTSKVHPSFSNIIKRLSPADAQLLKYLSRKNQHAIARLRLKLADQGRGSISVVNHLLAVDGQVRNDTAETASSIDVLESLGLITTTYIEWLADSSAYDVYYNCSLYQAYQAAYSQETDSKPEIKKGVLKLTDLGKVFISVCVE